MDEAESVALKVALDTSLGMYDEKHRFTAEDIRKMHKVWLGGIYEWAGEYRQVNVSKGKFLFAAAKQIPLLMEEFDKVPLRKYTPCKFKSLECTVQSLAEVHVELVLIHPFREGNGPGGLILSTLITPSLTSSLSETFSSLKIILRISV